MASVKVAVRVRPFNQREVNMKAVSIIEMEGKKTRICNSKVNHSKQEGEASREKYKDFTFDYSYWSFDSEDSQFASQEQVFQDLGTDVVKNAFEGYNACVFAYGQTGSGKTHTMMGAQNPIEAQGLIPRICMDMFNRMNQGKAQGTTYSTEVSYLEIYNERVKDLLAKDHSHNLKVREHPKLGPYVEDLSKHLVRDYGGIVDVMSRGNANRTTASTNMNDTSSRSHAIFTMNFVQARLVDDMPSETVSKIHLVDLAGSERADATGATGTRLKEGAHINKSLVTLGSVISALAEISDTKNNAQASKSAFIPYRDSVLTWLLKDSLGGNAKTIMIATISPADCNYGETLSTLRYANRAKNIINKPTINEDPNVKLIRELRAEIDKLKRKLASDLISESAVLEELHKKEAKEKSLTEEWTEKWKETQKILMEEKVLALRKAGTGVVLDSNRPHLIGIDDDLLSTGITLYHLKEGETKIGSDEESKHDIILKGSGLEPLHCSINLESGVATLVPFNNSLCWVNGQQIDKPTKLFQGGVILLGRTSMFRYNDPAEAEKLRREGSRSHLNLSRLSFLSRSVTELGLSSENLESSAIGEGGLALEEKRKQLEAEEARLQKESLELLKQKQLLEEQKSTYQQLQQQKEETWTAEIQSAQKELEERKTKLEHEYSAHRRRLAEDWKRLESQEQETLASLQSKETDIKKRRELLEWEVDQEMNIIESEAVRVENLKTNLESKEAELNAMTHSLNQELRTKFGTSRDNLAELVQMDEKSLKEQLDNEIKTLENTKNSSIKTFLENKEALEKSIKEIREKISKCDDKEVIAELQNNLKSYEEDFSNLNETLQGVEKEFSQKTQAINGSYDLIREAKDKLTAKKNECSELNNEIESSILKMQNSEEKIGRIESDLLLIAEQEKNILSQLAHINSSKKKLLTIIEQSTEDDVRDNFGVHRSGDSSIGDEKPSANSTLLHLPKSSSRDSSPNHIPKIGISDISPIRKTNSPPLPQLPADVQEELQILLRQIGGQKSVVLECLENDSDTKELNTQVAILQELRRRYLDLESYGQNGTGVQNKWFGYVDEDDDSFYEKLGEIQINGTPNNGESELDDSEALSSVTDTEHDDHFQALVDQQVEKRLEEIFEQLRSGKRTNFTLDSVLSRRNFRRSMPSDLNTNHLREGIDFDDGLNDLTSASAIPRSVSMVSNLWSSLAPNEGVLPGILDICILSYMLRGAGRNEHYQYEVLIIIPNDKWSVLRRYTRFTELRKYLKNKYGSQVLKVPFPPKRIFRRRSESVAIERKKVLEDFLKNIIQLCSKVSSCPLYNCNRNNIKSALLAFSPFFEKGIFDSTKYGTS